MSNCLGSFQKWYFGNYLRDILMADSAISEAIDTKIFPLVAPENTEGDFILYGRKAYTRDRNQMGVHSDNATIEITIVSEVYDNALWLASQVDNILEGQHQVEGIRFQVELADSNEEFQENKYVERLYYIAK